MKYPKAISEGSKNSMSQDWRMNLWILAFGNGIPSYQQVFPLQTIHYSLLREVNFSPITTIIHFPSTIIYVNINRANEYWYNAWSMVFLHEKNKSNQISASNGSIQVRVDTTLDSLMDLQSSRHLIWLQAVGLISRKSNWHSLFPRSCVHFGLSNALATFQRMITKVFDGLTPKKC